MTETPQPQPQRRQGRPKGSKNKTSGSNDCPLEFRDTKLGKVAAAYAGTTLLKYRNTIIPLPNSKLTKSEDQEGNDVWTVVKA